MRKLVIILASLMTLSCQEIVIQKEAEGKLSLLLENSPVVEVVTRTDGQEVSTDDFNVYVSSKDAQFAYVYKDMPSVITVPAVKW